MLPAILSRSWKQHLRKQQLYGHIPPIKKTIQVRRNWHARRCWRSKDELISGILLWTSSHRQANVRRLARSYKQQLCADTGYSLDLPGAMYDRNGWREKIREIHVGSVIWWWYILIDLSKEDMYLLYTHLHAYTVRYWLNVIYFLVE